MKNIKNRIALCLSMLALPCLAQKNTVAAGGDIGNTNGSLSFSVGQVFYTHHNNPDASKNAGVQQPIEFFTVSTSNKNLSEIELTLFPNPSSRNINLHIKNFDGKECQLRLFSMTGAELLSRKIQSSETTLELDKFAQGSYILRVEDQNHEELKTFRVVKN